MCLSQFSPVHTFIMCFSKIPFIIIFSSTHKIPGEIYIYWLLGDVTRLSSRRYVTSNDMGWWWGGRYLKGDCRRLSEGAISAFPWRWFSQNYENFSHDSRYHGRDSNQVPPRYMYRALPYSIPLSSYYTGFIWSSCFSVLHPLCVLHFI
jgi:hypothetical protein